MKINTVISLSNEEKELLAKQCFKEFCDCINKCNYERLKQLREFNLPIEKKSLNFELNKLCRTINENEQRAFALCNVAISFVNIFQHKVIGENMTLFYVEKTEKFDWAGSSVDKLALYVMCRAGIISKQERDRIIQIHKYSGELDKNRKKFRLLSRTIDKIYELKKIIRDDSAIDLIMNIACKSIKGNK